MELAVTVDVLNPVTVTVLLLAAIKVNELPPVAEAVSGKLTGPQVVTVLVEVITGFGFTGTVIEKGATATQEPVVAVTTTV